MAWAKASIALVESFLSNEAYPNAHHLTIVV